MKGISIRCARCGQAIVGQALRIKSSPYCVNCYDLEIAAKQKGEQERQELYNLITEIFNFNECPIEIVSAIDKLLEEGKDLSGIKTTVWYYYKILENDVHENSQYFFYKLIKEQYMVAQDYVQKMNELNEKNMKVNLDVPPRTVIVHVSHNNEEGVRKQPNYKMEDL